jgi:hypothetical protein
MASSSSALGVPLAKYVGRWVAVRDHEVIADAATAALLDGLEAARAGAQAGRSRSSPPPGQDRTDHV